MPLVSSNRSSIVAEPLAGDTCYFIMIGTAVGAGGGVGAVAYYDGSAAESTFELERGVGLIVFTLLLFDSITLKIGFCFSLKQQKMSRQLTRVGLLLRRLLKSSADSSAV